MTFLVVTGTDTGVGKTVVSAAVVALALDRGARVAYVKAAQTGTLPGEPGDLDDVCRLSGLDRSHTFVCGIYPEPMSPAAAARAASRPPVHPEQVVAVARHAAADHDLVVVEGAGGLLVRFDEDGATIADVAAGLDADLLVVTRLELGTLNHTALTLEAVAHRGLRLGGVVVGAYPAPPTLLHQSNVRDLEMLAARPLSGALGAGSGELHAKDFLVEAQHGLAAHLGGRFDPQLFREHVTTFPARAGLDDWEPST